MLLVRNKFFTAYGFWHWGEGLQTVLFTWYMTFHADLSATEIGFYQALVLSPFLAFTVLGGVLTDRIGARLSYAVSTSLFGIILISYGIVDHQYGFVSQLFFLYCICAGTVSAISNPAIDTFIPEATELKTQDNILLAATAHNLAKLGGNLTGLLLPVLSAMGGFIANGALMLCSVIFLSIHRPKVDLRHHKLHKSGESALVGLSGKSPFSRIIEHFSKSPESFDIFLSSTLLGLIIVPSGYILLPLVLRERFPEHGDLIALIGLSYWIGAIAATSIAKRQSVKIVRPGVVSLAVWASYGLGLLFLTIISSFLALCLTVVMLGGVTVGKALIYGNYLSNCPERQRGLFVGVDQTAFWGLATLGTAGMGALIDTIGLNPTIISASILVTAGVAILCLRGNLLKMTPV